MQKRGNVHLSTCKYICSSALAKLLARLTCVAISKGVFRVSYIPAQKALNRYTTPPSIVYTQNLAHHIALRFSRALWVIQPPAWSAEQLIGGVVARRSISHCCVATLLSTKRRTQIVCCVRTRCVDCARLPLYSVVVARLAFSCECVCAARGLSCVHCICGRLPHQWRLLLRVCA